MALFILFCDVTAELTNQELRFGLKIPLVVIANGAQNSNLSKIFGSLLFSYRMGPLGIIYILGVKKVTKNFKVI